MPKACSHTKGGGFLSPSQSVTVAVCRYEAPVKLPPCISPSRRPLLGPITPSPKKKSMTTTSKVASQGTSGAGFVPSLRIASMPPGYGGHVRGDVVKYTSY